MTAKGLLMAAVMAMTAPAAHAGWVGTWQASPQPRWEGDFPLPTLLPFQLADQTVSQPLRISVGGPRLRVVLSNEYGKAPLRLDTVRVRRADGQALPVTFGGADSVTIPPGAPVLSDPVDLPTAALDRLVVDLHVPGPAPVDSFHWDAQATGLIAPGNQSGKPLQDGTPMTTRLFLSGIAVETDRPRVVIALGDSITDGAASGLDQNARWPDFLAQSLAPQGIAVQNAGISGSRLLRSKMGENALARLDRDVFAQPGLAALVVLIGINDIAWPGHAFAPDERQPTVDELVAGYRQIAERAHLHGVPVVAATPTPFKGALTGTPLEGYYTREKDALRQQVNAWIREGGAFDAVVDLDRALQDPADPLRLRADDQADGLHLSAAGNARAAEAIGEAVSAVVAWE